MFVHGSASCAIRGRSEGDLKTGLAISEPRVASVVPAGSPLFSAGAVADTSTGTLVALFVSSLALATRSDLSLSSSCLIVVSFLSNHLSADLSVLILSLLVCFILVLSSLKLLLGVKDFLLGFLLVSRLALPKIRDNASQGRLFLVQACHSGFDLGFTVLKALRRM